MERYLLERFVPTPGEGLVVSLGEASFAAHPGVRLLQTIYVPEDEVCFYLVESESLDLARLAGGAVGVPLERVHLVHAGDGEQLIAGLTDGQASLLAGQIPAGASGSPAVHPGDGQKGSGR